MSLVRLIVDALIKHGLDDTNTIAELLYELRKGDNDEFAPELVPDSMRCWKGQTNE